MAEKLTLKNAKLVKGEEVKIRGTLGFTRYLTKPLQGKELEDSCAKREYATDVPHYEGTLVNPKIVAKEKGNPTDAEKVIAGKIYDSKNADGEVVKTFRIEKKLNKEGTSKILFGAVRKDGQIHKVDVQGKSLLAGQEVEVTMVTREYEYKGKKGLSLFLDSIVFVNGEPELFKASKRAGWADDDDEAAEDAAEEVSEEEAPEEESSSSVWDD